MKSRTKLMIGIAMIVAWISFIRWADTNLPAQAPKESADVSQLIENCQNLKTEKERLENEASSLAKQALALQSQLMRDRLKNIANKRILSDEKTEILIEYLSYDMMKLVKEKSDVFGDSFKRNIQLRPAVVEIIDRLIEQGELQPTYFEEVQHMGESLRKKYSDAREIISHNKNCFIFESEINEMIDEATEKIENGTEYNGWIADHTAEELVDSMH